jgi:hypothetical protein
VYPFGGLLFRGEMCIGMIYYIQYVYDQCVLGDGSGEGRVGACLRSSTVGRKAGGILIESMILVYFL